MQILVHVSVADRIVCGFLGGVDRGVEVLQLVGELHANFEGVRHDDKTSGLLVCRKLSYWLGRYYAELPAR